MTGPFDIDAAVHSAATLDEVVRLGIDVRALRSERRETPWWRLASRWRIGGELVRAEALLEEARGRNWAARHPGL